MIPTLTSGCPICARSEATRIVQANAVSQPLAPCLAINCRNGGLGQGLEQAHPIVRGASEGQSGDLSMSRLGPGIRPTVTIAGQLLKIFLGSALTALQRGITPQRDGRPRRINRPGRLKSSIILADGRASATRAADRAATQRFPLPAAYNRSRRIDQEKTK
jgi:hypothetical protein